MMFLRGKCAWCVRPRIVSALFLLVVVTVVDLLSKIMVESLLCPSRSLVGLIFSNYLFHPETTSIIMIDPRPELVREPFTPAASLGVPMLLEVRWLDVHSAGNELSPAGRRGRHSFWNAWPRSSGRDRGLGALHDVVVVHRDQVLGAIGVICSLGWSSFYSSAFIYSISGPHEALGAAPGVAEEDALLDPRVGLVGLALVRLQDEVHQLPEAHDRALELVLGDSFIRSSAVGSHTEFIHNIGTKWDKPRKQDTIYFNPLLHHVLGVVLDRPQLPLPYPDGRLHHPVALGCANGRLDRHRLARSRCCHRALQCHNAGLLVGLERQLLSLIPGLVQNLLDVPHDRLVHPFRSDAGRPECTFMIVIHYKAGLHLLVELLGGHERVVGAEGDTELLPVVRFNLVGCKPSFARSAVLAP